LCTNMPSAMELTGNSCCCAYKAVAVASIASAARIRAARAIFPPPSYHEALSAIPCFIAVRFASQHGRRVRYRVYSCCRLQLTSLAFCWSAASAEPGRRSGRYFFEVGNHGGPEVQQLLMTYAGQRRLLAIAILAVLAVLIGRDVARAQINESGDLSIELV